MARKLRPGLVRTFAIPALIAMSSLIGIFIALLGDGGYDYLSWFALGVPSIAIGAAIAVAITRR